MKIALVLETFGSLRGTTEIPVVQLVEHLNRLGHDVHVVARSFRQAECELLITPHRMRGTGSILRRARQAEAILRDLGPHVVHDMGVTWCADAFTPPGGSPVARQLRQLALSPWWKRPATRLGFRLRTSCRQQAELSRRQLENDGSTWIVPSERVADDYRSLHGDGARRLYVIPPGVDIKRFAPHVRKLRRATTRRKLGIEGSELLLLTAGSDLQETDWAVLFDAMRRLHKRRLPARLVAIGGERSVATRKLAKRYRVAGLVQAVDDAIDPIPYYAAADLFVLPVADVPCNAGTLEAAACGLPCVTTAQNGTAQLFRDGVDACILDKNTGIALAERIAGLWGAPRRDRMGKAARRTAMAHTLQGSLNQIVAAYEEIAERKGGDADRRSHLLPPGIRTTVRRAA